MKDVIERRRLSNIDDVQEKDVATVPHPSTVIRELNNRSLYHFLQYFWNVVSPHVFVPNWHIEYLCHELEKIAERVGERKEKEYDLVINIPPGMTKTIICSIMFPAWCWTKWYWMRFICASYSGALSLETAEYCRDLIRSKQFQDIYPDISVKEDKDTKSNFRITKIFEPLRGQVRKMTGGFRYSTSVGGTLIGFHGDVLIVDDPINPNQAASAIELANANRWMEQTLSTRKTDKLITPTILIMQRLHQDDPSGHLLDKQKQNLRHICLPGEIRNFRDTVRPAELVRHYRNDLLDVNRLPWAVLNDMKADLGQYGYAGQVGQSPVPPGGGMFEVEKLRIEMKRPDLRECVRSVRYWDKAGSEGGKGPFTVGVKMTLLSNGQWIIEDVRRGRWGTAEREKIIRDVAEVDGTGVQIWIEQEPGSGGKESAEGTIRNLAGFAAYAERPTGDKVARADPFSVQVNAGNVMLLYGAWNREFIDELRFFPYSTYKDQVDAASGAFSHLTQKKMAQRIT